MQSECKSQVTIVNEQKLIVRHMSIQLCSQNNASLRSLMWMSKTDCEARVNLTVHKQFFCLWLVIKPEANGCEIGRPFFGMGNLSSKFVLTDPSKRLRRCRPASDSFNFPYREAVGALLYLAIMGIGQFSIRIINFLNPSIRRFCSFGRPNVLPELPVFSLGFYELTTRFRSSTSIKVVCE